jgi:hypothetical protein
MGENACVMKALLLDLQSESAELRDETLPVLDRIYCNPALERWQHRRTQGLAKRA